MAKDGCIDGSERGPLAFRSGVLAGGVEDARATGSGYSLAASRVALFGILLHNKRMRFPELDDEYRRGNSSKV